MSKITENNNNSNKGGSASRKKNSNNYGLTSDIEQHLIDWRGGQVAHLISRAKNINQIK